MDSAFRRWCSEHHCLWIGPRSPRRSLHHWLSCPIKIGMAEGGREEKCGRFQTSITVTGFEAMKMEPWLSPQMDIGLSWYSSFSNRDYNQTTCLLQLGNAMYSASMEEYAICCCCCDFQLKIQLASLINQPVWEWQMLGLDAQLESVNAIKPAQDAPSNTRK